MAFALFIVYRDGKHHRQRYARHEDATRAFEMHRTASNVSYLQLNGPAGMVGRYVADA